MYSPDHQAQLDAIAEAAIQTVCAAAGVASQETFDLLAAQKPELVRQVLEAFAAKLIQLEARVAGLEGFQRGLEDFELDQGN